MMSATKIKQDAPMSVLFTMLFAGQIASTIFLPGLPSIAAELNIPRSIVQTMVPVYLAAFASTQLIIGPLSDKFGRKPIVLLGILLLRLQVTYAPMQMIFTLSCFVGLHRPRGHVPH